MTTTPRPVLDLFTGTGSLGRATTRTLRGRVAAIAEINPHAARVAEAAHPDVPNLVDALAADYTPFAPAYATAAGTPCQDVSGLGRRAGMGPGTRSGLWSAYCRAIAETGPTWVVWENVLGVLSTRTAAGGDMRALGRVLADLYALGYDVQWRTVRASDIGAPHHRARVFVLARARRPGRPDLNHADKSFTWYDEHADEWITGADLDGPLYLDAWPRNGSLVDGHAHHEPPLAPLYPGLPVLRTPVASEAGGGPLSASVAAARGQTLRLTGQLLSLHAPGVLPEVPGTVLRRPGWHEYGPAIGRWEEITGRPCPPPLIGRPGKRPTSNPVFGEWLMQLTPGIVTGQPITHREKWAAIGNGVVQGQAEHALTGMLAAHSLAA